MRHRIKYQIANNRMGYPTFEARLKKMYKIQLHPKARRRLRSVRHYLVNENEKEAETFFIKFEKELKKAEKKLENSTGASG